MKQALISRGRLRSAGVLRAISIIRSVSSLYKLVHFSSFLFSALDPVEDPAYAVPEDQVSTSFHFRLSLVYDHHMTPMKHMRQLGC